MKHSRILVLLVLAIIPLFLSNLPGAHANYRINSTTSDTWPSTYGQGSALVTSIKVGMATGSTNEILVGGSFSNNTANQAELRIYHKTGNSLVLDLNQLFYRAGIVNTYQISGIEIGDIDGSGVNETIFTTNISPIANQPPTMSQIGIYRYTGTSLTKEKLFNFTGPQNNIETRGLAIWTYNGIHQIITIGYYVNAGINYDQLGIWSWDGTTFTKNALYNWTSTGTGSTGSQGFAVAAGDVEGTGVPDIVTVGSANNGTLTQSEIRIFGWTGSGSPISKQYRQFVTTGIGSAASSVAIRDLIGDGKKEIVVGGQILIYPFWHAELTVWTTWGGQLTQLAETNWITSSQTSFELLHVSTGDIDNSGNVEIVTSSWIDTPVGTSDVYDGVVRAWTWNGFSITLQKVYQYPTIPTILLAVTVADVDRVGRQDILLGGQQSGKGFVEIRDVAFVNTSVSLNVNPLPANLGQSVTISGALTNSTDNTGLGSTQLLIEYTTNGGGTYQIIGTLTTDSQGRYATSFTPTTAGSYTVRATWNGDDSHTGTSMTSSFTVSKMPSVIVLSSSSTNVHPGDLITISGYIYPAIITPVTITYTGPGGVTVTHTINSTSTGSFTDQYAPNNSGKWTITASWTGSNSTANASSSSLNVQVQNDPLGVQLSLYGFVIAIAALGLGIGAYFIGRKTGKAKTPSLSLSTS